jgi:S1-C subfamily serine protease
MKNIVIIVLVVGAVLLALGAGAVAGGALVYMAMRTQPALAASLRFPVSQSTAADHTNGVLIADVQADSPAASAGIVRGDIILQVNGNAVNSYADLKQALAASQPGDTVSLLILHGDAQNTISLTTGDQNGTSFLGIIPCTDDMGMGRFLDDGQGGRLPSGITNGVVVTQVVDGSPAAQAGLQHGDVITAVDGTTIDQNNNLADLIGQHKPGDTVKLSVTRSGTSEALEISVTLAENPDDSTKGYLGISFVPASNMPLNPGQMPLNPDEMPNGQMPFGQMPFQMPNGTPGPGWMPFQLPEGITQAVLVGNVVESSPAASAGIQQGDLITEIDGQAVTEPQQLVDAVQSHQPGDKVTLTIYRVGDSQAKQITVTLGENPNQAGQAYMGVSIGSFSTDGNQQAPGSGGEILPGLPGSGQQMPPFLNDPGQTG